MIGSPAATSWVWALNRRTTCPCECPFDSGGVCDSRDLAAKVSFERRAPWDQAEPQSIIDHREAPRGKVKALSIRARDCLALTRRMIRNTSARTDARCRRLELLSP